MLNINYGLSETTSIKYRKICLYKQESKLRTYNNKLLWSTTLSHVANASNYFCKIKPFFPTNDVADNSLRGSLLVLELSSSLMRSSQALKWYWCIYKIDSKIRENFNCRDIYHIFHYCGIEESIREWTNAWWPWCIFTSYWMFNCKSMLIRCCQFFH